MEIFLHFRFVVDNMKGYMHMCLIETSLVGMIFLTGDPDEMKNVLQCHLNVLQLVVYPRPANSTVKQLQ